MIAVSGGQDSLCLLQLLVWWQPEWHWQLYVGHCDHQWRGDSTVNRDHVVSFAATLGISCMVATADPIPHNEAEAREWRYQALTQMAIAQDCERVVTGHTLSDRAETLIYNLIRGSGAEGLAAMAWSRPLADRVQLVRPLLGISRQETGDFCHALALPVYLDSTNQQTAYRRNRIRLELIPYLAKNFNPRLESALWQTAEILQAEQDYLARVVAQFWQEHDISAFYLERCALQQQHLALQRRIIKQFLEHHLRQSLAFAPVEKCRRLLSAPNRTQTDPLAGNYIAVVQHPYLCLTQLL